MLLSKLQKTPTLRVTTQTMPCCETHLNPAAWSVAVSSINYASVILLYLDDVHNILLLDELLYPEMYSSSFSLLASLLSDDASSHTVASSHTYT